MATFVPKKQRTREQAGQPKTLDAQALSAQLLDELVVVARIGAAYGIKGWAKIHPFSHSPDALSHAKQWWIAPYIPDQALVQAAWQSVAPKQLKPHADAWVAVCEEWGDRTHVEQLKGWQIAIPRSAFPQTEDNEFYWVDLMGAQVINQDNQVLGEVVSLLENAAHTVMQVRSGAEVSEGQKPLEYLIPFVSAFVGDVDLKSTPKTIAVTWDVDATA